VLREIFDLVVCHAVLEWLADPRAALSSLAPLLASDGQLSLLFYNRNAALLKRVLHGEFGRALDELADDWQPRGWGDGCVPLAEDDVSRRLTELGLSVQWRAGIRIFHDHLTSATREGEDLTCCCRLSARFGIASRLPRSPSICTWSVATGEDAANGKGITPESG
jgi:S-adenosylmethionine-dependent methyltransferase